MNYEVRSESKAYRKSRWLDFQSRLPVAIDALALLDIPRLLPVTKDVMTGPELLRNLALIYAWTGEKDLAIDQIAAALKGPGHITYGQLRLHPWWDSIRNDPRFEPLVEEAKKPVNAK